MGAGWLSFGGSESRTTSTTNINERAGEQQDIEGVAIIGDGNTVLDGGVIRAAFDFSEGVSNNASELSTSALAFASNVNNRALTANNRATQTALTFANNFSRADGVENSKKQTELAGYALAALVIIYYIKSR